MDKVILLDTNVASAPIHRYLADAGYEVYVVGRNPSDFLAKAVPNYINLDYSDVEATLALVERLGAKYLVPGSAQPPRPGSSMSTRKTIRHGSSNTAKPWAN